MLRGVSSARHTRFGLGPRVLLGLLIFGAGGAAALWWGLPRVGDIAAAAATHGGGVTLARRAEGNERYSFIESVASSGHRRWRTRVGALAAEPQVLVADGRVVVRATGRDGRPWLVALDAEGGKRLWQASPLSDRDDIVGRDVALDDLGLLAGDGRLIHFYGAPGGWSLAVATALSDGAELWRRELGPGQLRSAQLVRPERVLVRTPRGTVILAATTGEAEALAVEGASCAAAGWLFQVVDGALAARPLTGGDSRALEVGPEPVHLPQRACGHHGDTVVLAVARGDSRVPRGEALAFDAADLSPRWRVGLGTTWPASLSGEAFRRRHPGGTPLTGGLPRYVPVQLETRQRGQTLALVAMLDVAAGVLQWRGAARATLLEVVLLRAGEHHLLYDPVERTLGVFDGRTGHLAAAVGTGALVGGISPGQVAGDRLWLHGPDAWAQLELPTLTPLDGSGGEAPWLDNRHERLKQRLGLPVGR